MLRSGNYLTTTLDGAPRYDKPMLSYWAQGISVSLLGPHPFAFRLPSMLAASLWLLLVFRFVREQTGDVRAAWLAASALALGLMPSVIGHAATADAILNLLIAATGMDLWRHLRSGRQTPLLRAAIWAGLGVLAKGPVAIAVPGAAVLLWSLWQRQPQQSLKLLLQWPAWLVLAAVVLPWGIACWHSDNGEFIRHFLLDHNVGRYEHTLQGHGGTPLYYLVALPLIVLPFTTLLPGALSRVFHGDTLDRYCLSWFAVVFVVFSFSSTQLPHYLLYGATPLFVLFGRQVSALPNKFWLLTPAWLTLALFASLPLWLPDVAEHNHRAWDHGVMTGAIGALGPGYVSLTLACLLLAVAALRLPRMEALVGSAVATQIAVWLAVVPALAAGQQAPTRAAARFANSHDADVVAYATHLPSFSVYRGRITPAAVPEPGQWVFLRADKRAALEQEIPADQLHLEFTQGGVMLMRRMDQSIRQETANEPLPSGSAHTASTP